jgi:hypothetical protein
MNYIQVDEIPKKVISKEKKKEYQQRYLMKQKAKLQELKQLKESMMIIEPSIKVDVKEKRKQYNDKYINKNKEKLYTKLNCDICNIQYTYINSSHHIKTNRHQLELLKIENNKLKQDIVTDKLQNAFKELEQKNFKEFINEYSLEDKF